MPPEPVPLSSAEATVPPSASSPSVTVPALADALALPPVSSTPPSLPASSLPPSSVPPGVSLGQFTRETTPSSSIGRGPNDGAAQPRSRAPRSGPAPSNTSPIPAHTWPASIAFEPSASSRSAGIAAAISSVGPTTPDAKIGDSSSTPSPSTSPEAIAAANESYTRFMPPTTPNQNPPSGK